jgi:hypothetical protein
MLQKVEPAEKGIPRFKDIYVSNVKVAQAKKAINASGLEQSSLENFNFSDVEINAAAAGDINYARKWTMKKVNIKAKDNSTVSVKNSSDVNL